MSDPQWHRLPDSAGYYTDTPSGRFQILRHYVDDRSYDGGRVGMYWICESPEGERWEMHTSLRAAKRDITRAVTRRAR